MASSEEANDYWRCNVCGEDTGSSTALELLVWNVFEPDGSGMRYEPSESPMVSGIDDWQELAGTVVHLHCLSAQLDATRAQAAYHRRTEGGSDGE